MQNVVEMLLDFVRVHIAEEILGKEQAPAYVPMLTTIFVTIFFINITGVIPFLNIASHVADRAAAGARAVGVRDVPRRGHQAQGLGRS